jgi:phage head maturation protease
VPFNVWAEIDSPDEGHFMERFAPGSLRASFADRIGSRLRGCFEHGRSKMFGRQPIMDIRRTWEQPDGAWYSAILLRGLPEVFLDGLRRGLYGTSIGAKILKAERVRNPGRSAHNPQGLEERTYTEVRAFDISLTPRPQYADTTVLLRAAHYLPAAESGRIYRASLSPLELAEPDLPGYWLPPPSPRRRRDYLLSSRRVYLPSPSPRRDYLLRSLIAKADSEARPRETRRGDRGHSRGKRRLA